MQTKICSKSTCNHKNESTRYFCAKCGTFLEKDLVSDENVFNLPEMKIMRILDNLKHVPHHKIMWDDTIDLYTRKVEQFKAMRELQEIKECMPRESLGLYNVSLPDKMQDFLEKSYNPEFQIAFVGTIKTGKSTLINALLGDNYASMAVTPETAALTKFRFSQQNRVKVTFYSRDEWNKLWNSRTDKNEKTSPFMREWNELEADKIQNDYIGRKIYERDDIPNDELKTELNKWSSSKSAVHYFVKEIDVGISTFPSDLPKEVVFVDTPGLSDPVEYRSKITQEYIRKADAVFVCIEAKKIQMEELATIQSVFAFSSDHKEKVHIIATQWDQFNDPIKQWKEQKPHLKKSLTRDAFFPNIEMAEKNIMHSSAYIYNLCRDYDILEKSDTKNLYTFGIKMELFEIGEPVNLQHHITDMQNLANIATIKSAITNELGKRYKEFQKDSLLNLYSDILHEIKNKARENMDSANEKIDATLADQDKLKKLIVEKEKNISEIKKQSELLKIKLGDVKKKTQSRLDEILPQLQAIAKGERRNKTSKTR